MDQPSLGTQYMEPFHNQEARRREVMLQDLVNAIVCRSGSFSVMPPCPTKLMRTTGEVAQRGAAEYGGTSFHPEPVKA
jgi:hypothetical protein